MGLFSTKILSSPEEVAAANRDSGMRRAVLRMRGFFMEEPTYGEEAKKNVVSLDEARSAAEAELVDEVGLDRQPVKTDAEGNVVDMEKYRRVQAASAEVREAFDTMPRPDVSNIEDLLIK
jgi:hypothetical protein